MGLRNRVGIGLLVAALSGSAVAQPASVDEIAAKYIKFSVKVRKRHNFRTVYVFFNLVAANICPVIYVRY